jgi:hypothetical protein
MSDVKRDPMNTGMKSRGCRHLKVSLGYDWGVRSMAKGLTGWQA